MHYTVKSNVRDDLSTTIACPICKRSNKFSAAAFKNKKHIVRVRCSCGIIFFAQLEFRKQRRKRVNLKGTYRTHQQYIHCEGKMSVSNLSGGGLKCHVDDYKGLEIGNILKLNYIVNDIGQRQVNKLAIIRNIHGFSIGCEFVEVRE